MKKWRFGIIGSGMIAHHHAKAIQAIENAELVGIYGRNGQNAKKCADIYQVGYSDDLNAFLKDQSLDIVTIASPSGCHMEHSIAAMESGIHVICEKPLEITPTRIDRMIESAEKNNVILSGIFNRRFNPAFDLLKKAVVAGRFGRITMVDAQIKWYRDQDYYDSGKWRGTWELDGGGALMNQSIHTIDQMQALVGKVKRISASVDCLIHERIEVEDAAVAIIEFENGARGVIQASTACWSKEGHPAEIQICGEKGSVFLMDEKFRKWEFQDDHDMDEMVKDHMFQPNTKALGANDPKAITNQGHILNIKNVINHLNGNSPLLIDGYEARKSVEIINAIYESAKTNKWISL